MELCNKLKSFLEFDQGHMDPSLFPIHELDITYYGNQKLDVYLPDTTPTKKPTIVVVHGGGWISGYKQSKFMHGMIKIVNYGMNVVSIDYSLSVDARYPQQIVDIKQALLWVENNADKYHFDLENLHIWGESAGAHLALLAGLIQDTQLLGTPIPQPKTKLKSIVAFYPAIDTTKMEKQLIDLGCTFTSDTSIYDEDGLISLLIGKENFFKEEVLSTLNPTTFIQEDMPRILLQHGTGDRLVPHQQSIDFYNEVTSKYPNQSITLELFDDAIHTDDIFFTDTNIQRIVSFINE
ncbi:alpha/beta hydrolase [Anaerorhabdus sp.]|uniref:alpha/beta hydrolase n=1 Tax=Anaerorhabdus sp. TaxID=1872524 RepID=UPI002FCCB666